VALSRNLGRKQAFEMLVTGAFIDAQQALAKGLINQIAEPAGLDEEVGLLVNSILSKPRVALALGKGLFYRQLEKGIDAAYADAAQSMACNMMDDSALEGVQAFIDKRPPDWHGQASTDAAQTIEFWAPKRPNGQDVVHFQPQY
jgi:enoyl-CoA hydratase/carnithine racemase